MGKCKRARGDGLPTFSYALSLRSWKYWKRREEDLEKHLQDLMAGADVGEVRVNRGASICALGAVLAGRHQACGTQAGDPPCVLHGATMDVGGSSVAQEQAEAQERAPLP